MKFDQTKTPITLNEAVDFLYSWLEDIDISTINMSSADQQHFTFGMFLRNTWKLWDKETPIVQWFRSELKIGHADDISSIILDSLYAKVKDEIFDLPSAVQHYHNFWMMSGCNEFGEQNHA